MLAITQNELLPPRIELLANSAKTIKNLRTCSSAAKERIVVRDSKGFPKELLPPTIQLFGDQNELLPPMINYRIFGCIELLAIKMNLNLCRHEVWGDQNELLQPMIEFLVDQK